MIRFRPAADLKQARRMRQVARELRARAEHRLPLTTHGEDYRPGRTPTIVGDRCGLRFDEWQPTWQTDQAIGFLQRQHDSRPWILN
jgi:hypothetical protein